MRLLMAAAAAVILGGATRADEKPAAPSALTPFLKDLQAGRVTTVEIPDGTYTTAGCRTVTGVRGTAERPVILRAANRGKVVIVGEAGFIFRECEHVVIEGFVFENDADQQCVMLENCRHVRITRNVLRPKERAKPRHWEHWVTVDGARSGHNRVDRNRFERKVNRGSPLFIRGDDAALVCSQHDRIDRNHFRDVIYANRENGHETIRTGGNDLGASGRSSFTVIEHNLLERCSGEDELISLKSSDNIVRHNTLINCRGAICMRLGNRSIATGNIILATEDGPGFGGIKLFGFEHRVEGNYFSGLTGTKHEAPFSLFPGMHDTPTTENIGKRYDDNTASAATRCHVVNNTWVDCAPLQMGLEKPDKEWVHLPSACVFSNNRVVRTKPLLDSKARPLPLVNLGLLRDIEAKDNVAYEHDKQQPQQQPAKEAAWTAWFRWDADAPAAEAEAPKPLTAEDVGPDAPESPQADMEGPNERVQTPRKDQGSTQRAPAHR